MKLYHFDVRDWGEHYAVMSDSPEQALEAVKKYIRKGHYTYEEFQTATIDNLPKDYFLVIKGKDEVIEGEHS